MITNNDETRPWEERAPTSPQHQGHFTELAPQFADSPVQIVLDRLEGARRASGGWTARCPSHEDRSPSLSVTEGRDGRALIHCFAGCEVEDIVRALGIELADLFPPSQDKTVRRRTIPRPRPVTLPRSVAEVLVETSEFAETWELAKLLAIEESELVWQDVLASWRHLSDRFSVSTVLRLAYLLRGVAMFRYCTAKSAEDAGAVRRAVRRLCEEVEHGRSRAA
jgi:hypothetical protein